MRNTAGSVRITMRNEMMVIQILSASLKPGWNIQRRPTKRTKMTVETMSVRDGVAWGNRSRSTRNENGISSVK